MRSAAAIAVGRRLPGRRGGRWLPLAHGRPWRRSTRAGADRATPQPAPAAAGVRRAPARRGQRRSDRAAAAAAAPLLPRSARPGSTRRSPSLLDRAAELFDDGDYTGALACAEEAARQAPRSVEAHHNRAIALMRLDRLDEARDALALALALAPDDPETLEAAADLNINQLPPSVDRSALGLEYARRGSRHVPRRDRERVARLALLEGQALIDLGRAVEALRRIDAALAASPQLRGRQSTSAAWRCSSCAASTTRAARSRRCWPATPDHAHALYHLGLIEERLGDDAAAARHLAAASAAADPKSFPPPPEIDARPTSRRTCSARSRSCRDDVRRDLGGIKVEAADLPDIDGSDRREAAAVADDPGPVPRPAARLHRARRARRRPAAPARGGRSPRAGGGAGERRGGAAAGAAIAVRRGRPRHRPLPPQPAAHRPRRRRAGPGDHPDAAARGRPPARRGRRLLRDRGLE